MGEVYKARHTRLDRIVAIKRSFAAFNERFEREARAIAALNHPNICTLYDVGPDYLVMELVDGKPLAGPIRSTTPTAAASLTATSNQPTSCSPNAPNQPARKKRNPRISPIPE